MKTHVMHYQQQCKIIHQWKADFAQLRRQNVYIDKSFMIQTIEQNYQRVIAKIRPSKWGKTTTLTMLRLFYSKNGSAHHQIQPSTFILQLFQGNKQLKPLKLAQSSKWSAIKSTHCQKYVVINIDFKCRNQSCDLRPSLYQVFLDHQYLIQSHLKKQYQFWLRRLKNQTQIHNLDQVIGDLISMLGSFYQRKVVVLIDNYDDFIFTAQFRRMSKQKRMQCLNRMHFFLSKCTKSVFFHRAIIFGICDIAQLTTNFKVSSLYNYQCKFKTSLGFTEDEVKQLIELRFHQLSHEAKIYMWNQISQNLRGYNIKGISETRLFCNSSVIQYLQLQASTLILSYFDSQKNNIQYLSSILQTQQSQLFFCAEFLIKLLRGQQIRSAQHYKNLTLQYKYAIKGFPFTNLAQFVHQLIHMGYLRINRNILEIANIQTKLSLLTIINNWIQRLFFSKLQGFTKPYNITSSSQNWRCCHKPISILFSGLLGRFIQCGESMFRYLSYVTANKYFPTTVLSKCDLFAKGNSLSFIDKFNQRKVLIIHRYLAVRIFNQKHRNNHWFQFGFREMFLQQVLKKSIADVQDNPEHKDCQQMILRVIVCPKQQPNSDDNDQNDENMDDVCISIEGVKNILSELEKRAIEDNKCKHEIMNQIIRQNNVTSWTDSLLLYAYKEANTEQEQRECIYYL